MTDLQPTTEKEQRSSPSLLEARIINATTSQEAQARVKVREELIKQNTEIENQQHRRFLEKGLFWSKQIFSYTAIIGGTILAMKGFDTLGYFIIGGGLYQVAPGYMRAIINKYVAVFRWVRLRPRRQPLGRDPFPGNERHPLRLACEGAGAPYRSHALENRYKAEEKDDVSKETNDQ